MQQQNKNAMQDDGLIVAAMTIVTLALMVMGFSMAG